VKARLIALQQRLKQAFSGERRLFVSQSEKFFQVVADLMFAAFDHGIQEHCAGFHKDDKP